MTTLSGFVHCESQFKGFVRQTWLSWLDDKKDAGARKIGKQQQELVAGVKKLGLKLSQAGMLEAKSIYPGCSWFLFSSGKRT